MRVLVLTSLLVLCAVRARAQERWAIIAAGTEAPSATARSARAALAEALAGTGLALATEAEVALRLEDVHSTEPGVIESDRIEELRAAVTSLEEHAALRQREAARAEVDRIRALSEGLSADLAEQNEVAEGLFAACIAEAWLHIQLREREEARQLLEQCRGLHPDLTVNPLTVAPPVAEMLRSIDEELARRPTYALTCAGVPSGCELRLDGRRRAVAPAPIEGVVPGVHRVEFVCEGMARRRVHRVVLGAEDRTLRFDPRFDAALVTRSGIDADVRLEHPTEDAAERHRVEDALTIAGLLEVATIVLASEEPRGLRLDRIDVAAGRVLASVVVAPEALGASTRLRAASALLDRESVDLSGAEPRAMAPWLAGTGAVAGREGALVVGADAAPVVAGALLAGIGALSYAAGWGAYARGYDLGLQTIAVADPATSPTWRGWQAERATVIGAAYGLGIAGAAVWTAALPLWLPEAAGEVPWWSWVTGGVGLLGVIPAALALEGNGRPRALASPTVRYDTGPTGALWLAGAAALLSVPLVHLVRVATGPRSSAGASVELGPEHAALRVEGTW
jgi:hypothetical protein